MSTKTVEQCAIELTGRLRAGVLAGLGSATVGHGLSLDFEEAVRATLADFDQLNLRHKRGAWIDRDRERLVGADIKHLHWLAEFRDRRR